MKEEDTIETFIWSEGKVVTEQDGQLPEGDCDAPFRRSVFGETVLSLLLSTEARGTTNYLTFKFKRDALKE